MDLSCLNARRRRFAEDLLYSFADEGNQCVRAWFNDIEKVATMIHPVDHSVLLKFATRNLLDGAERWYKHNQSKLTTWSDFKQGMIAQFDKNSNKNDTNATMQSEALMKERRRTTVWHPQHVAYYRSYHSSKSCPTRQTTSVLLSPFSLFESDSLEASWPDGTESWLIHEIRPQRESFINQIDPEPLIIIQETSLERENQSAERVLQLDRDLSEPVSTVDQISILPNQPTIHLSDVINVDTRLREPPQSPETKSISNVLHLKQQDRCALTLNDLVDGSLIPSHFLSKLRSRDQCCNRLLRLLGLRFVFLLSLLFTVLICFGIVYHSPNRFDEVAIQSLIFASIFIFMTMYFQHHLTKSKTHITTIEILRNLESLLIYDIT
jgi:hypothetical protein